MKGKGREKVREGREEWEESEGEGRGGEGVEKKREE